MSGGRSVLLVHVTAATGDVPSVELPVGEWFDPMWPTLVLPCGVRVAVDLGAAHGAAARWWSDLAAAAANAAGWHAERDRDHR